MPQSVKAALKNSSPYSGGLTREQFLFYEMRSTAQLKAEGLSDKETIEKIISDNLFQYPTEKSISNMASVCIRRLNALENDALVSAIAELPSSASKQICLYEMMRQYRLVWDFMVTVIGEKYLHLNYSFSRSEIKTFLMSLQEQDDWVASWSESTITKIGQVLVRILIETEYLDDGKTDHINPVLIHPILENAIREAGLNTALPAFNCIR